MLLLLLGSSGTAMKSLICLFTYLPRPNFLFKIRPYKLRGRPLQGLRPGAMPPLPPKGVARGVSRLPGPPPPPQKIIHRPNWVKPRGERFGGQSTVVGPPPPLEPPPPLTQFCLHPCCPPPRHATGLQNISLA